MTQYFTRQQVTEMLDQGLRAYLEAHIESHQQYTRKRVEDTRIAEGADPEYVRGASLYALEYGNIGSSIANPEYMRSALKGLEAFAADGLYTEDENYEPIKVTDELLAAYDGRAYKRMWPQEIVDIIQKYPDRTLSGMGDCGSFKYFIAEGLLDVVKTASAVPAGFGLNGHFDRHSRSEKGHNAVPVRWKIEQLIETNSETPSKRPSNNTPKRNP